MNREQVWSGIFAVLEKMPEFAARGRTAVLPSDAPAYPAVYLVQLGETAHKPGRGIPIIYTASADIVIYVRNDSNSDPAPPINDLIDATLAALLPPNPIDCKQTLGGLVEDAWVEGQIDRSDGALGGFGAVVIPFKILSSF